MLQTVLPWWWGFADEAALRHWVASVDGSLDKIAYDNEVTCVISIPENALSLLHDFVAANRWRLIESL